MARLQIAYVTAYSYSYEKVFLVRDTPVLTQKVYGIITQFPAYWIIARPSAL